MAARVSIVIRPRSSFAEPPTRSAAMPAMATWGAENVTGPDNWPNCESVGPVEIDVGGHREIALLRLVGEDRRQVEAPHVHVARDRLLWSVGVGHQPRPPFTRGRTHVERDSEAAERAVERERERGRQRPSRERRQHGGELRHRQLLRRDLQLVHRRGQVVLDCAVDGDRAFGRAHGDTVQVQRVVAHRDAARQRVERQVGARPAKRHVGDVHRVTNGLVVKRHAGVEPFEPRRHVHPPRRGGIVDHDRSVADADLLEGNRASRARSIGFPPLPLDDPGDGPSIVRAPEVDDRLIETQLRDRDPPGDHLERVVFDADVPDSHRLTAVERQGDVLQLDPVEQVAAEACDRQPAVEVLVGLLDDVAAEPVAEPGGLRRHQRGRAGADHQHERDHQSSNPPPRHLVTR